MIKDIPSLKVCFFMKDNIYCLISENGRLHTGRWVGLSSSTDKIRNKESPSYAPLSTPMGVPHFSV